MNDLQLVLDAISLYQTQYDLVDKIWGYFSIVTLAVVGFVISSDKAVRTMKEPLIIVCAYIVFCFGNHDALLQKQDELIQIGSRARELAQLANFSFSPVPNSLLSVKVFHICVFTAVAISVLLIARLRLSEQQKPR